MKISPSSLSKMKKHCELALEWNVKRSNLSGSDKIEQFFVHTADSLAPLAIAQDHFRKGNEILDIGSGAGFPGIPLILARNDWKGSLLESSARKRSFLRLVISELDLTSRVDILSGRAEKLGHELRYREKFDFVFGRAVTHLKAFLEIALPFVSVGGSLICYMGEYPVDKLPVSVIEKLGGIIKTHCKYSAKDVFHNRYILLVDKIKNTPELYSRRAGIPSKNPLS